MAPISSAASASSWFLVTTRYTAVPCVRTAETYGTTVDNTTLCGATIGSGPTWTSVESTEPYDVFGAAPTHVVSLV